MSRPRRDPFEHFRYADPVPVVVPFPAARNRREVDRAARAIFVGRSPSIDGWIDKRARELAYAGVAEDLARADIEAYVAAVECRLYELAGEYA